jgi:hypothetical protein
MVMETSRVYSVFFNLGEVVEIRAIGGLHGKNKAWEGACFGAKGTVSGYFDNAEAFGAAAEALDKAGAHGVYFTLNPCKSELLARAANRLKANVNTTTDADIEVIRWLPIDLDPDRASGISSSQGELDMAKEMANEIVDWLAKEAGFRDPVKGFSGNGYHIVYRLEDHPNTPDTVRRIKGALVSLSAQFKGRKVLIDEKVFNPSRIWKVYGTHARKGDSTPLRPHRQSRLLSKVDKLANVVVNE